MSWLDRRRARRWARTQSGITDDTSDEPRLNANDAAWLLNGSGPTGHRVDSTVALVRHNDRGRVLRAVEVRR